MKILIPYCILSIFLFFNPSPNEISTGTITITITNVEANSGIMRSALYDEAGFLEDQKEVFTANDTIGNATVLTVVFKNVPYGEYAFACYQDTNSDWKLNGNMVGIPNEAYAFTRPPKSKWRKPKFKEVAFELNENNYNITTEVKFWGDY